MARVRIDPVHERDARCRGAFSDDPPVSGPLLAGLPALRPAQGVAAPRNATDASPPACGARVEGHGRRQHATLERSTHFPI